MILIFIFFCCLYILFFLPVLLSGYMVTVGDNTGYFIPSFYTKFTLWENSLFSGFPAAFDPQLQSFYPIKLIFQSISISTPSYNAYLISAYVIASCSTYGYVRKITHSKFAGLISGISYGLSMALIERIPFVSMIHTVAWLPLILWGIEQLKEHKNERNYNLLVVAGISLMFLAGHPQSFVYSMGVVLSYISVYLYFLEYKNKPKYLFYQSESLRSFGISILLSIGVTAVLLIPQIELMRFSGRASMSFEGFNSGSLHPLEIINFVYPYLLGGYQESSIYSSYFGYLAPHEVAGYAGTTSILLTVFLFTVIEKRSWQSYFWLAWIFIGLILSVGGYTPLSKLIYLIPGYNLFRGPSRHTFEIAFSLSVLSGICIAKLQNLKQYHHNQTRKVIKISLVFLLIILALLLPYNLIAKEKLNVSYLPLLPWNNFGVLIPLCATLFSTLLVLWFSNRESDLRILPLKKGLIVIFVCFDLASASWFGIWRYYNHDYKLFSPPNAMTEYRKLSAQTFQRVVSSDGIFNGNYQPNFFKLWQIQNAGGYNPLMLARYSELLEISPTGDITNNNFFSENKALDILACKYILIMSEKVKDNLFKDGARWKMSSQMGNTTIYENKSAMPRAWFVSETVHLKPKEILTAIKTSILPNGVSYDPQKTALIESGASFKLGQVNRASTFEIVKMSKELMELQVSASNDSFLVVSDVYYPGWKATIDNKETEIYPTNYVLRGIYIPAGNHAVKLTFRPYGFYVGLGITSGTLVLLGYLAISKLLKINRTFFDYCQDKR